MSIILKNLVNWFQESVCTYNSFDFMIFIYRLIEKLTKIWHLNFQSLRGKTTQLPSIKYYVKLKSMEIKSIDRFYQYLHKKKYFNACSEHVHFWILYLCTYSSNFSSLEKIDRWQTRNQIYWTLANHGRNIYH